MLVTSYHSFQGASAVLLDPAQGDVTSSTHIDPWSRDLVPAAELKERWRTAKSAPDAFEQIARHFKVSQIVAGRRAMDLGLVDRKAFFAFYEAYTRRERQQQKAAGGGDFYNNQNTRVGPKFATSVIYAALEGRLTFREAYDLTGLRGGAFQEYARRLGVDLP